MSIFTQQLLEDPNDAKGLTLNSEGVAVFGFFQDELIFESGRKWHQHIVIDLIRQGEVTFDGEDLNARELLSPCGRCWYVSEHEQPFIISWWQAPEKSHLEKVVAAMNDLHGTSFGFDQVACQLGDEDFVPADQWNPTGKKLTPEELAAKHVDPNKKSKSSFGSRHTGYRATRAMYRSPVEFNYARGESVNRFLKLFTN